MQAAGAVSARGVNYDVSLSCDGEMLHLTLWQRDADRKWIGSFNTRCARRPAKRPSCLCTGISARDLSSARRRC